MYTFQVALTYYVCNVTKLRATCMNVATCVHSFMAKMYIIKDYYELCSVYVQHTVISYTSICMKL